MSDVSEAPVNLFTTNAPAAFFAEIGGRWYLVNAFKMTALPSRPVCAMDAVADHIAPIVRRRVAAIRAILMREARKP